MRLNFENENTFGLGDKIHSLYERALKKIEKNYLGKKYSLIINGKRVFTDKQIETFSPIDRETLIGKFQIATKENVVDAIEAAHKSFEKWEDMGWEKRCQLSFKAYKVARKRKFEIAAIVSYENGKNRYEAIGEVDEGLDFLKYYPYLIIQNNGLVIDRRARKYVEAELGFQGAVAKGEEVKIVARPFGVWSVIAPFNFPFSISIGMSSAALITGNTVVFKPSFGDNPAPLSGYIIYEIFEEAGFPKGVFNYITGFGSEIGDELILNEKVRGIAFTGSKDVGFKIYQKIVNSKVPKQLVVEMGSKNPVIVSKYANLDKAVKGIVSAAFGFCGQKCSAASRIIIHKSIYKKFLNKFLQKVKQIKIGNPLEKDVYMGPLISENAYKRYLEVVEKASSEGKIIYGGFRIEGEGIFKKGFYVAPTVVEVPLESEIFKKELFLPIVAITTYTKFEDAIKVANSTEYGLTAGLYSENENEIDYFNKKIEFGTTYVNRDVSATTGAIVGWQTFVGNKASSITCKGTSSLSYLLQFVREHSQTIVRR